MAPRVRNFGTWARHVTDRLSQDLTLMTTITTFATAVDVTVAELQLEAFLPADQHTAEILATTW
jgi:hypothetical protein